MPKTTKIHVAAVDNELYILATQSVLSTEICHVKANTPVSYDFVPQQMLPPGQYNLIMIGINWGGPQAFKVIVTTGGVNTTHTAPVGSGVVGDVWHITVPITV